MNVIFRHVGSIRPLKNKLYSDEILFFSLKNRIIEIYLHYYISLTKLAKNFLEKICEGKNGIVVRFRFQMSGLHYQWNKHISKHIIQLL